MWFNAVYSSTISHSISTFPQENIDLEERDSLKRSFVNLIVQGGKYSLNAHWKHKWYTSSDLVTFLLRLCFEYQNIFKQRKFRKNLIRKTLIWIRITILKIFLRIFHCINIDACFHFIYVSSWLLISTERVSLISLSWKETLSDASISFGSQNENE